MTFPIFPFDLWLSSAVDAAERTPTLTYRVQITTKDVELFCYKISTVVSAVPNSFVPTIHDGWLDEVFSPRKKVIRDFSICHCNLIAARGDDDEHRAKLIM